MISATRTSGAAVFAVMLFVVPLLSGREPAEKILDPLLRFHPGETVQVQIVRAKIEEFIHGHKNILASYGFKNDEGLPDELILYFPISGAGGVEYSHALFNSRYAMIGEWRLFFGVQYHRLKEAVLIQRSIHQGRPLIGRRLTLQFSENTEVVGASIIDYTYRDIDVGWAGEQTHQIFGEGTLATANDKEAGYQILELNFVGWVIPQRIYLIEKEAKSKRQKNNRKQ